MCRLPAPKYGLGTQLSTPNQAEHADHGEATSSGWYGRLTLHYDSTITTPVFVPSRVDRVSWVGGCSLGAAL